MCLVILSIYYIVIIKGECVLVILSIFYIVMIKESVFSYTINLLYCDDKGECA